MLWFLSLKNGGNIDDILDIKIYEGIKMNEVKYLLKFEGRKHLDSLQKGNLYFSNAITFWYYEEKLFIKGQGDRLEGGSFISAQNLQ